jgi:hypothetical protein
MPVLWVGHEAECYTIETANNIENAGAYEAGYERTGFRVGRGGGQSRSRPDFPAQNEIWHRFRHVTNISVNQIFWGAEKADGTMVARIIANVDNTHWQFQISADGVAWTDVGGQISAAPSVNSVCSRFDVHLKAAVAGQIEVYYGAPGGQLKVLDVAGDFSAAAGVVRIYHGGNTVGGGYDTDVGHAVVQTTPTLATTSEVKPPTSDGADVDGTGTYADVDETPYSDADLLQLPAVGNRHSFKSAARALTQNVVSGITVSCRAWYEAGGPTSIKAYLTIGGVRYYSPAIQLSLIAEGYQYTFLTNPATGLAFTTAEANDATLEYGFEATA